MPSTTAPAAFPHEEQNRSAVKGDRQSGQSKAAGIDISRAALLLLDRGTDENSTIARQSGLQRRVIVADKKSAVYRLRATIQSMRRRGGIAAVLLLYMGLAVLYQW